MLCGRGFIEGAMARWTSGGLVYSSGKKGGFLKRLDQPPPEIWEIRVTEPDAQGRLFGRFAGPDVFILTKMYTRGLLGDKGGSNWQTAITNTVEQWDALFPEILPFSASTIHQYVTSNCDDFRI